MDSTVWENETIWRVWSWCLLKANFIDNEFPFNGKDILVKRGQFITGRNKALEELPHLTAQKYRTAIKYLKSTNRITTEVTNQFTIITICKYDDYQKDGRQSNQLIYNESNQPITNGQPTANQRITTNKNIKKEKNEEERLRPKSNFTNYSKPKFNDRIYRET
ncbi:MAG TPA: hypothetical protein VMT63_05740 [Bacteroidales bacterium]|nr:hypothetical protein [Bacteroidales bacterium]